MEAVEKRPWRFTIEFDAEKARQNGYDVEELYDCVGRNVEPRGNVRMSHNTWQAVNRDVQIDAQCAACSLLAGEDWVMKNVKSWRTYEDINEPDGSDYLAAIRRICPELIYD